MADKPLPTHSVDLFHSKLREEMNNVTDDLALGCCNDFAEYKHLCGVIEGFAKAERLYLDSLEEQEMADNEVEKGAVTH